MSEIDQRRLDELRYKKFIRQKLTLKEERELGRLFKKLDRDDRQHNGTNPFFDKDYCERRATISCIELSMRHDNKGNVVDWMKEAHK